MLVRERSGRSWAERVSDFLDYQRPPLMLLMAATVLIIGGFLYLNRPDAQPAADPLDPLGAAIVEQTSSSSPDSSTPLDETPAGVSVDTGLTTTEPPTTDQPATTASITGPSSTEPATTTELTTTTEATLPPTTQATQPTTTTTTEPTTTTAETLEDCFVTTRSADVYAGPSEDTEEIGRAKAGTYLAVAFTEINGGWVLIQGDGVNGWIESDRIRDAEGACT